MSEFDERIVAGLRVRIDRNLCVGFGDCMKEAPEGFKLDDDGIAVFVDPDRFQLGRPDLRKQLAFAQGPHTCIGVHLARLETRCALANLLALPDLAGDPVRRLRTIQCPATRWGKLPGKGGAACRIKKIAGRLCSDFGCPC